MKTVISPLLILCFLGFLVFGRMHDKKYELELEILKCLRGEDPENLGSIEIWELNPSVLVGGTRSPTKRQWQETIDFCEQYFKRLPKKEAIGAVMTTERIVLSAGEYLFQLDLYSVTDSHGEDSTFDRVIYERLISSLKQD